MAKFFNRENDTVNFMKREEMQNFLDFRKEHDKWVTPHINDCAVIGVPNLPLLWSVYTEGLADTLKKSGYKYARYVPNIDMEKEENYTCATAGPNVFFVVPVGGKFFPLPTANFAYIDLCARGGDTGSVMLRQEQTKKRNTLPIEEKAARLTRDYTLVDEGCKVLYRDHMVCAVHSESYVIMPMSDCIEKVEESLEKHFPDYFFKEGAASHFYFISEYLLNDEIAEARFSELLKKAGVDIDEVKAGLMFYTSDVGESSVTASMYYTVNGKKILLGKSVKMAHKGEASLDKFAEELEDMGQLFKDGEERIEELGNTPIAHPAEVLLAIREKNTWLPKAIVENLAAGFDTTVNSTTAVDIYLALNDAIDIKRQNENLAPETYINLCEQVAKLLYLPYAKIDNGEEWS